MKVAFIASTCAGVILATQAPALVEVRFSDGVPWDVFTITNNGCPVTEARLVIDLSTSVAGVLIDTTYGGPGTQDPLPAEVAAGRASLFPVADGDQQLTLDVTLLDRESDIRLQMDVDDTSTLRPNQRISVAQSEIAGATASLTFAQETTTGVFDNTGLASLPLPSTVADCNFLS